MTDVFIDPLQFKRILRRNVLAPLGLGFFSAVFFSAIVYYLLTLNAWVAQSIQGVAVANETYKLMIDQETGMRGFLIAGEESFLDPYERGVDRVEDSLQALREYARNDPLQLRHIELIDSTHKQWLPYAQRMIELRRQGRPIVEYVQEGRGKAMIDRIRSEFNAFIAQERQVRVDRTRTAERVTWLLVGSFLLFSLGFSGVLMLLARRDLLALSEGYQGSLEQLSSHAGMLEREGWLRSGQNQLSEAVIGEQSMQVLGQSILGFLARYLDAGIATLYVLQDGKLQRVAEFAHDATQLASSPSLALGEGLAGQAALERRLRVLNDLPAGYLRISSALGGGSPTSVMILPVESGGTLNAVLEIGLLRPAQERDAELLERISESLGSAIESARYRVRLHQALAQTQQLNEELQVQQEELRAANEELEAQSGVLRESQQHLEEQQAELEQTNEQLSEQAQALERQRDEVNDKNARLQDVQRLLEQRAEELQRASRYKSEFLANMSHELRTPLNSSLILAKLLADNAQGNLSEDQVQYARSIYGAGNDLLTLINDILDIAKVEAGKMDVRPELMILSRVLDSLRNLFMPQATEKSLQFFLEYGEDLPASLYADRQRLEQIIKNLLSNAFKFTEEGTVTLRVERRADGLLAFQVRDTGIGIAESEREAIFEAFRQADGTTNRRYGGTGLGLSISRELAHLLGGSIEVDSEPGVGSTFTLLLPERYDNVPAAPKAPPASVETAAVAPMPATALAEPERLPDDRQAHPFKARSVLVIEDEPRFACILRDLAHELGYNCLLEQSADSGFESAMRYQPDAILLDMRLPDHSGLTVLERLKETPETRHIPVHIVSVEDRKEAALQMGAIGYAMKPATREELREVFLGLEARLAQKVKRILLVEDDALQRASVSRLIEDEDVEITAVEFGQQALELLRDTVFDCMIIDLKLPDMDGSQLLERMACEDICSFPPVIVYTGRNLSRDEEAALMKYSHSIIIKGARSPERLLDEVTLFLHKVESDMPPERRKMLKSARSREKTFEGRTILVVDDDVRNVFALTSALEQKGARVEIARNGHEAIARLHEVEGIDLVLMDIMMPEMDGFTAMREIRKEARFERLPIIAVTAKAMKDDQDRCLAAGANDYLAKPIELDRLFSLIRVWLPKVELL
ncbi:response regulator [Stutzerimonas kirkiae]|uniref:histidine kinase n=1 Tax=Stutzerimonas kirkiae TaxID=2211392 RepID=A0A4Q9R2S2_9GAMM|nr:response regulator [Stutzerimonas kirkiae]TBU92622.1 two-component system sensor histidine kinase/response regulator [Stutzerimonas kirkiae]TBV00814.1 two-component system sensor histidine kinase/response regulator [Stutzerimonas kirkiae]TBV08705.1 two-component system sensor histidine kinase/response regulator [Stutzerimonas kirkiae]TBV11511.1 two-component system sensor histidine kinase/response regulator [Stutzerimonas kirkiae]